jgi:hypothetical protein
LLALAIVAVASLGVGALLPQAQRHKAYSEDAESKPPARPTTVVQSSYYMVIFASQPDSNETRLSHTFATFVKAGRKTESEQERIEETHTISWMPRSFDIAILRRRPEDGTNLDLPTTLRWAQSVGARIYAWGPYQIEQELYGRALRQEARLNSGAVQFKVIDEKFRPESASNCIHAVIDIDMDNGLQHVGRQWGEAASGVAAEHLRRWIIAPERKHPWVVKQLGLSDSDLIMRDLEQRQPADAR